MASTPQSYKEKWNNPHSVAETLQGFPLLSQERAGELFIMFIALRRTKVAVILQCHSTMSF